MNIFNKIEFICVNNDKINILPVLDPIYIYKVGDKFKWNDVPDASNKDSVTVGEFEVVDVKHFLEVGLPLINPVQLIEVHIKYIK